MAIALALAAGKPRAGLADQGVVAPRQGEDELVGGGLRWRRPRSRPGVAPVLGVGDVGGDGVVEQERLLGHQGDLARAARPG